MATRGAERERDLERFLTLVDAMVAIAITLLVLPLVDLVPSLQQGGTVGHLLHDHIAEVGAFGLSFWVIARLWLVQHVAVGHLVAMNPRIYWLLMVWALTIVFLPFPTALVATHGSESLVKLLYIGTFTLSEIVLTCLQWVISRDRDLTDGRGDADLVAASRNTVLLLVALVAALAFPVLGYWPLLVLTLDGPIRRLGDRLRH